MTHILLGDGISFQTEEPAKKVVEIFRNARLAKLMYVQVAEKDGKYTFVNPAQVKIITDMNNAPAELTDSEDDTEE